MRKGGIGSVLGRTMAIFSLCGAQLVHAQQPTEPVDPSPINGETYYFIDQLSALQLDLKASSSTPGDPVVQNAVSFTSLSQRWATTKAPSGKWKISNIQNGLCLDSVTAASVTTTVQNTCAANAASQEWTFNSTSNGYNTIVNAQTGNALDIVGASTVAGTTLTQTALGASPTQSQQWLFRPVFFRGNDNSIQEKQEALRVAGSYPWWQDAGQQQDLLQILKNHGFNMVRIRPTSIPPYATYTAGTSNSIPATCTGNGCYAETDAADLDLAKRAKQLGMSVELSLFFDGGSSSASPGAWSGYTVAQTQTAIYNYTKAEVEAYRSAGVMPDMVTIGNEVDTGFLASLKGSPSGAANSTAFQNFAAYETSGMQAVADAAADTTLGPAIPTPIRCIHITPAWDLTSFFGQVNTDNVPYDAVCQSYYPIYHGPLTQAQATASNPNKKPVEQTALTNAATSIGKPIFLIEIGEHYESGFDAADPWYPETTAGQRQFVLDVQSVLKGLPNNLGMGIDYWDGEGTNIPNGSGFTAGDGKTDATFVWNGLTLFDNADTSGSTQVSAATYNAVLPALSAVGGKLDASLKYKLVNANDGRILETTAALTTSGAALDTAVDTSVTSQHQQWVLTSTNDGYFQIANANTGTSTNVLDTAGMTADGSTVQQVTAATGTASQEWDVVTAGNGYFTLVNKASSMVLSAVASGTTDAIQQQSPSATNADWITPKGKGQMWQLVPVHISAASSPGILVFDSSTPSSIAAGGSNTITVDVENTAGALIGSTPVPVTLTITGPDSFSQTLNVTSANGAAAFTLTGISTTGTYTLSASSAGLNGATQSLQVISSATTTVLAASATTITTGATVKLTATVSQASGTGTPTGTVTFLDGTSTLGTGTLSGGVATFSTSTLVAGSHSITASYGGDAQNAASTSSAVSITVSVPADYSVSFSPASATITNGSSATTTVTVTPVGGFNAAVSFACSGLPLYTTCTFSPTTVTPNGAAATTTLTIGTNVATASMDAPLPGERGHRVVSFAACTALAGLSLMLLGIGKRRKKLFRGALGCALFGAFLVVAITGCSGGGHTGPTPAPIKTPAGTSTVTVTATPGSTNHTATFQLTVQ